MESAAGLCRSWLLGQLLGSDFADRYCKYPTAILLRSMDLSNRGVRIVSNSRITVDHPGIYSFTFSIQFSNTDTQIHDVNVWLREE
jgi:hypothetical protein